MVNPTPGSGGVPYTHREIFLAANYSVGKGLDTYSGINNTELQSKNSFKEIVTDFDTLATVRSTEELWDELVISEVVKQLAESEFTVEYAAKHAPGIEENTYQDVQDLIEYSNIASADPETIEWLLNIHLTHIAIWNDVSLYNKLLKHNEQWMDYFINLTSFGNPINRLHNETIIQLALYAVGDYQQDPYSVFSDQAKIDALLKRGNDLNNGVRRAFSIPTNHDGFIAGRNNNRNTGYGVRPFSTKRWRSSEYTNYRAIGLLEESLEMRRIIAQGRLGLNDPTFRFTDLFDGTVFDNFWDYDWDYEFIEYASADVSKDVVSRNSNHPNYDYAYSNIDTSTNIKLKANADSHAQGSNAGNNETSPTEKAQVRTHSFDVSNKNSVKISIDSSNSHTEHKRDTYTYNYSSRNHERTMVADSKSSVTVSIGNSSKQFKGGEKPEDVTFDISNTNTIQVDLKVQSDADTRAHNNYDVDSHANAAVNITSIDIS